MTPHQLSKSGLTVENLPVSCGTSPRWQPNPVSGIYESGEAEFPCGIVGMNVSNEVKFGENRGSSRWVPRFRNVSATC